MANSCRSSRVFQGRLFAPNQSVVTVVHIACFVAALSFQFSAVRGEHSTCRDMGPSPNLTMFVDPLPIPPTIDISNGSQLILGAYKITQKLHKDLIETELYAYGTSEASATYPGPTLVATRHQISHVRFENHINDSETFLRTDRTLHWANPSKGGVPIVTHLHGGECASESDGHPEAWHTAAGEQGKAFVTQNYTYPNSEPSSILWYHDHTVGITRINVLAGLAGLYIIRSPSEEPANLPQGPNEIPLVIQDKRFWANGSINFPDSPASENSDVIWCSRYFGDTILVNGKVYPYLNVFPEKYRFRMLNAANDRFFNLKLSNPSLQFIQIGTDGGFLEEPLYLTELGLAPAYRADVIIDFSNMADGTTVYLNNSGIPGLDREYNNSNTSSMHSVMAFKIISRPQGDRPQDFAVPSRMAPVFLPPTDVNRYRSLTMVRNSLTNTLLLNNASWMDPATENPQLNTTEIWDIINTTPDAHPIHIHLINYLVLQQQAFNQTAYSATTCSILKPFSDPESCFTEDPQKPNAMQVGWKDTVIMYPFTVTRLWISWAPRFGGTFPFDPKTGPGYVWHCHLLGHEDNDMMRPLNVTN